MEYKEFELTDGSKASLPISSIIGGVVPVGFSNRMPVRVRLPFPDVSDKYGYPSLYFRKTQRRMFRRWEEVSAAIQNYTSSLERILAEFSGLLSSYDESVVLPTTSALSYVPTCHFDLDEKGVFGHSRKFEFPSEILDFILHKRVASIRSLIEEDIHLSLKRGTNLGWPTQKSNSARLERDILLATHVALSLGAKSRGYRLEDVTKMLQGYHGQAFAVAGERLQHTDRVLPIFTQGLQGFVWHCQPRVRGIYFSPKYCVAWNRVSVKRFLKAMMLDPMHTQDRNALRKWFATFSSQEFLTFSIDVSRFDQSVGGEQGRTILRLIASALEGDDTITHPSDRALKLYSDLNHEFSMPCLVRTSAGLFLSNGAEILSSGLSTTSLIGTTYSEALVLYLASQIFGSLTAATSRIHREWSALTWGDDIVFSIRKDRLPFFWPATGEQITNVVDLLAAFSVDVDLEFTQEPTLKFLGQNYDMGEFSDASTDYPVGRYVQQQFFPERLKVGAVQNIGVIARSSLLHPSLQKRVFDLTMSMNNLARIDKPFSWEDRAQILADSVSEVATSSESIVGVDDVLNLFTHGLEADDLDGLNVLPDGLDSFEQLLSSSTAILDDPSQFLSEVAQLRNSRLVSLVNQLASGEITNWIRILQEIQKMFGGSLNRNDSYY